MHRLTNVIIEIKPKTFYWKILLERKKKRGNGLDNSLSNNNAYQ